MLLLMGSTFCFHFRCEKEKVAEIRKSVDKMSLVGIWTGPTFNIERSFKDSDTN